jgi:hypothetical protein
MLRHSTHLARLHQSHTFETVTAAGHGHADGNETRETRFFPDEVASQRLERDLNRILTLQSNGSDDSIQKPNALRPGSGGPRHDLQRGELGPNPCAPGLVQAPKLSLADFYRRIRRLSDVGRSHADFVISASARAILSDKSKQRNQSMAQPGILNDQAPHDHGTPSAPTWTHRGVDSNHPPAIAPAPDQNMHDSSLT